MSYEYRPTIHTYERQLGTESSAEPATQTPIGTIFKWGLAAGAAFLLVRHFRMRKNPDDEDILEMLTRYKRAGIDISELLEGFGVSREKLGEQVASLFPIPTASTPVFQERKAPLAPTISEKLVDMYEPGMNIDMLAKKFGVSGDKAEDWLAAAGLIPDKQSLIEQYTPGMSISKLAKKHGVHPYNARRWLMAAGLHKPRKGKPGPAPSPVKEDLVAAYEPGMSISELARKFGVGSATADRWLKEAGVYVRVYPFEKKRKGVLETYEPGMDIKELAKEFDVSEGTVRAWLKRAGLMRSTRTSTIREKIIRSYVPGMNVSELARKFNVLPGTAIGWLQEEGIYVPSKARGRKGRKGPKKDKYEKVIRLYQPGMNVAELAREVGVHYTTIIRWLKESGMYEPRGR